MQAKIALAFLLSFLSIRYLIADLVTNDEGIERRGNKIRVIAKNKIINQCE